MKHLESPFNVSIIIPTRDQGDILRRCIESLFNVATYSFGLVEIIVIDNQSKDVDTLKYLSDLVSKKIIRVIEYDAPFNYSAMNNLAVNAAKYDVVCLMNNDIEVISPHWLEEMVYFVKRSDIGCVGAKLYYPNDTIQHAGVVLGINGVAGHVYKHSPRDAIGRNGHLKYSRYYSAVTAACMVVGRSAYLGVGGFDEKLSVAYNDVDFCLKLGQSGFRHVWTPRAELYHHESVSRGTYKQRTWLQRKRFQKEVRYMKKKWGDKLLNDPAWDKAWPLTESWNEEL